MAGSAISRRLFVKGVAIGVVTISAGGVLSACGGSSGSSQATPSAGQAADTDFDFDHASLIVEDGVAVGAGKAYVDLVSNAPFTGTIPLGSIELGGLLAGYGVTEVERLDDTTIRLMLAKNEAATSVADDSTLGIVCIEEGAFADDAISGYGAIPVRAAIPLIDPENGCWDEQAGLAYLPIDLDVAEFTRAPQAVDFSLADSALAIAGVDYDASNPRAATLHIGMPQDGAEQAFEALDRTLTDSGVRIAGAATNCGDLVARSQDVLDANGDASITALSCLAAHPIAIIDDIDVTADTPDDPNSDMTAHLNIQIQVDNGSIVLPVDDFEKAVDIDNIGDGVQLLSDIPVRVDDTHFYADLDMTRDAIDLFTEDGEDADTDQLARDFATVARAHIITISDGIIKNAWGVPQEGESLRIFMTNEQLDEPQTPEEDQSAAFALQKAYAAGTVSNNSDLEKAKQAFEVFEKIAESAGAMVTGIIMVSSGEMAGVGEIISGAGSLFGLIDGCLGFGQGDLVSLKDILGRLDDMDEKLNSLESEVDKIEKKIEQVEVKLDYQIAIQKAAPLIQHATLLGSLLAAHKDFMSGYDANTRFDQISGARKEELTAMINDLHDIESTSSFKAYSDANDLGGMIAPDATNSSIIAKYFACVNTRYNWEPEALTDRQFFFAHVGLAFEILYMWAMLERQYNYVNNIGSKEAIDIECKNLAEVCQAVTTVLVGTYDADRGYTSESALHIATHARSDGKVLNLVNNRLYDQSAFIPNFFYDTRDAYCHGDPSDVKTYKFDGTLKQGDLDLMVGNLANAGYTTLTAEFTAMGFNLDKSFYPEYRWNSDRCSAVEDYDLPPHNMAFLVSDCRGETINNKPSNRHTKAWYGDYYSFDDNAVVKNAEIYVVDQKYHADDSHWHTKTSFADASIFR